MNLDWERLGAAVTAARRAAGMSQVELADKAGLSRSAVQGVERGRAFDAPQLSHRSIAQALGWTPDSISAVLIGGEPMLLEQPVAAQLKAQQESPVEAGVDALLDDLTARVREALLGGTVADATAIDMGPDDDGEVVIIWKRGEKRDLTPEQQRDLRRRWGKLQHAARDILADGEEQEDQ